jgi:hypothetical protein
LGEWTLASFDGPNPTITWNGSQPGQLWNNVNNWTPANIIPNATVSVIIPGNVPQPIIGTPSICANALFDGSTIEILSGQQLLVGGNVNGSGTVTGSGKLSLNGTGLQTLSGLTTFSNLEIANASAQGVVVAPAARLTIAPSQAGDPGLLSFLNNSRLNTNNNLILGSNSFGTGKIGPVPVDGSGTPTIFLTGEVTQQRFLPGWNGGWTMLGSPMAGKNFTDWVDDFKIIGPPGSYASQGGSLIVIDNPYHGSIFKLDESVHNIRLDTMQQRGWRFPASSENIEPGKGYRTFISASGSSFSTRVFDNTGSVTMGTFNWSGSSSLTRNELTCSPNLTSLQCNISDRGWNLIANPYPCDIDWDAPSGSNLTDGWQKPASMLNASYRYNNVGLGGSGMAGYGFYLGGDAWYGSLPAPANPRFIPASQGFLVNLALPGTYSENFTIREAAKAVSTSGSFLRTQAGTTSVPKVKLDLLQDSDLSGAGFRGMVQFTPEASDEHDLMLDFPGLGGPGFYFAFPVGMGEFTVNSMAPLTSEKIVPMVTQFSNPSGTFSFRVFSLENLEGIEVFLKDKFENVLVDLKLNPQYSFLSTPQSASMADRFELVFSPSGISGIKNPESGLQSLRLMPNPTTKGQEVNLVVSGLDLHSTAILSVVDALGRMVAREELHADKPGALVHPLSSDLPAGVYTIRLSQGKRNFTHKWVVR